MSKKRIINLLIGPVLLLLFIFLLPDSVFTTTASKAAIGSVAWMAYWWVTGPVDYAVTAFLPIALNALLQIADMKEVISNYASETILLLLGASILTVSWEKTGLDKRIASVFLRLVGINLRMQLVFWFILSALLSSVLPNSVVCATVTPIITGYLRLKMPILRCFSKRASQMNVMLFCVLWTIPTQQEEPMRKGRFNEFMRTHIFSHFNKT